MFCFADKFCYLALLLPLDPATDTLQPGTIAQDARRTLYSPATACDPPTPTITLFGRLCAPRGSQRVVPRRGVVLVALLFGAIIGAATGEGSMLPHGTGGGESHGTAHARRPSRTRVRAGGGRRFPRSIRSGPCLGPG